jgi:tetratricopeptide (TPR) repeat protein
MQSLACGLLTLTCSLLFSQQAPVPSAFEAAYDRAKNLQSDGDTAGAETLLNGILDRARSSEQFDWTVKFLDLLASLRAAKGDLSGAKRLYVEELEVRRSHNLGSTARVLLDVGIMAARLNDYEAALEEADNASKAARLEQDSRSLATAANLKGQVLRQLGRITDAEAAFNDAATLFDRLDSIAAVRVRVNLADLYWRRSEYRKALITGFAAEGALEKGDSPRDLAAAYDALGNTFKLLQQDDRALEYFQKSLAIREKLPDRISRAFSYNNLGIALNSMGRPEEARGYHLKALEIRRAAQSQRDAAQSLINLAVSETEIGRAQDALEHYKEAAGICEKYGYSADLATAAFNMAELLMSSGQWAEAEEKLTRALILRQEGHNQLGVVRCLSNLALVREHLKSDSVEQDYRSAMVAYETVAAEVTDPERLGSFQQASIGLYQNYARYLIEQGRPASALEIAERGRGVGLSRLAAINAAGSIAARRPEDREAWRQAELRYNKASNGLRMANEHAARNPSPESRRSWDESRAEFTDAARALSEARDRIYAQNRDAAPASLPQVDAEFVRALSATYPDTLFLEWLAINADQMFLFSITNGTVNAAPLTIKPAILGKMVADWKQAMRLPESLAVKAIPMTADAPAGEKRIAHELYGQIFGPRMSLFRRRGIRRLVIVRDGPLLDAPLSALMDDKGKRLIESFAIRSEVSLARCTRHPGNAPVDAGILVVADPLKAGEIRWVAQNNGTFEPLEYANQEGKAIAALDSKSVLLTAESAREAAVRNAMPTAAVVHFATHAFLGGSLRSGLLLATESSSSADDGVLEAREIAEIPMRARLVVLSACETLLGEFQPGEGLIGLAWSFQAAGVHTVTASLWPIDDAATAKLMLAFYRSLRRGNQVDDALRTAMLEISHDRSWYRPYFWASFAVFGSAERVWHAKSTKAGD